MVRDREGERETQTHIYAQEKREIERPQRIQKKN